MNGIKYFRCKNRMTLSDLDRASGVNISTISKLEKKIEPTTSLDIYVRIASALSVTLDDLLIDYDDETLQDCDHPTAKRKSKNINNCLEAYRRYENLTFQQLGVRMGGLSRQRAQMICAADLPNRKALELLAQYEGISLEEFEQRYAVLEGRCA